MTESVTIFCYIEFAEAKNIKKEEVCLMDGVRLMKQMLFEELGLIVRTTTGFINRIKPDQWEYKPAANMRSLKELAQHLVMVPSVDLLILREGSEEEARKLEGTIAGITDAESLAAAMERGVQELQAYMDGLSEEQFLQLKTRPYYTEDSTVQAKWLIEVVTHAQHHRAQLFMYLKLLGHDVNMFNLYG